MRAFPGKSCVLLCTVAAGCLLNQTVRGGSVSLSKGGGCGNALVTATSAGFQPSGTNYVNTGFYSDTGGLQASCPPPMDGAGWANCSVQIRMPVEVGPHTITAANSLGEHATTTYQVNQPTVSLEPAFGPVGTHMTVVGSDFAALYNVGIYIDNAYTGVNQLSDESGSFTATVTIPSLSDGAHEVKAMSGANSVTSTFTVTNCVGSVLITNGTATITHPDGTTTTVSPGSPAPVQMNDRINTGPVTPTTLSLMDGTSFKMSQNTGLTVDNYVYDPSNNSNNRAGYSIFGGAFQYLSGLISKKPDPNVHMDTMYGSIGIRGTQLITRHDPCSTTQEVYLIEGQITIAPQGMGITNVYDAPVSIFFTPSTISTSALTQVMYDSLSSTIFPTNNTVTLQSWLTYYFGCTNNAAAGMHADADGDGQDNYAEFLAGTDPSTNASVFHIVSTTREGNDVRVTWTCGGGRTNVVQSTSDLLGSWSDVSTNIVLPGNGLVTTNYLHTGALTNAAARFYRVEVK